MKRFLATLTLATPLCLFSTHPSANERPPVPKFTGTAPSEYLRSSPNRVRWGREILFRFTTTAVPGQRTQVQCELLPRGAAVHPVSREFRWFPTQDQIGTHAFDCSLLDEDEATLDRRTLRFEVGENRPPEINIETRQKHRAGGVVSLHPQLHDADSDPVTCHVRDVPKGATLPGEDPCHVRWDTTEDDPPKTTIVFTATDGIATTLKPVEILLEEKWESYLLPGAYYGMYRPVDHAKLGTFHGPSLELVVASWIHRNDNHGPSHGRASLKVDLLSSTREGQPVAFLYAAGVELSVERNPLRRYLIPFFGADVGGLTQRTMGHRFQVTPRAGLYLWTTRNLFVTLAGGYIFVPGQIETLRGWRANLGFNLTLW